MQTTSYWSATHTLPDFPAIDCDIEVAVVVVGAGLTAITATGAVLSGPAEAPLGPIDLAGLQG